MCIRDRSFMLRPPDRRVECPRHLTGGDRKSFAAGKVSQCQRHRSSMHTCLRLGKGSHGINPARPSVRSGSDIAHSYTMHTGSGFTTRGIRHGPVHPRDCASSRALEQGKARRAESTSKTQGDMGNPHQIAAGREKSRTCSVQSRHRQ